MGLKEMFQTRWILREEKNLWKSEPVSPLNLKARRGRRASKGGQKGDILS